MDSIRRNLGQSGLVRPANDRILGGVCAGLGRRFGISPWTARLLFVLILMIIPGSQILIYPVLWILMPDERRMYGTGMSGSSGSSYPGPSAPAA